MNQPYPIPRWQIASHALKAWRDATQRITPETLPPLTELAGHSYERISVLLDIHGPEKTLCGHDGWHLLLQNQKGENRWEYFARQDESGIIHLPAGNALCPLKNGETKEPLQNKGWTQVEPTDNNLWFDLAQGDEPIEISHVHEDYLLTKKASLLKRIEFTQTQEETRHGKQRATEIKAETLAWNKYPHDPTKAQAIIQAAIDRHETILLRYLSMWQAAEQSAAQTQNWAALSRLRHKLANFFPDRGKLPKSVNAHIWELERHLQPITIQADSPNILLQPNGYVVLQGTPEFQPLTTHATLEEFEENKEKFLEEYLKRQTPKTKGKITKKSPENTQEWEKVNTLPAQPQPGQEPPTDTVVCLQKIESTESNEGEWFALYLKPSNHHSSTHGAISSTGYHSINGDIPGDNAQEIGAFLQHKFEAFQKENTKKPSKEKHTAQTFDPEVLEHCGKTAVHQLITGLPEKEDLFYTAYHALQGAVDEILTLRALHILETELQPSAPPTTALTLKKAAQLLTGVHSPMSRARSLKWQISREIIRKGKNLEITTEDQIIRPACQYHRAWDEKREIQGGKDGKTWSPATYREPEGLFLSLLPLQRQGGEENERDEDEQQDTQPKWESFPTRNLKLGAETPSTPHQKNSKIEPQKQLEMAF